MSAPLRIRSMSIPTDKPLAAHGLTSYRYWNADGWIMIGATSHGNALNEASRSISDKWTVPSLDNLQVWNGERYVPVKA